MTCHRVKMAWKQSKCTCSDSEGVNNSCLAVVHEAVVITDAHHAYGARRPTHQYFITFHLYQSSGILLKIKPSWNRWKGRVSFSPREWIAHGEIQTSVTSPLTPRLFWRSDSLLHFPQARNWTIEENKGQLLDFTCTAKGHSFRKVIFPARGSMPSVTRNTTPKDLRELANYLPSINSYQSFDTASD